MSARASHPVADTSDREIVITRLINAPRELVFAAWTDPRHIDKWFGPQGFTTKTSSMDLRPGGMWRFVMSGPSGEFPSRVVFHEIVRPALLAYTHGSDIDNDPDAFEVTVTFEDLGDKTHLTLRSLLPSAEAREKVVRTFKAIEGGHQTLQKLEQHVSTMG